MRLSESIVKLAFGGFCSGRLMAAFIVSLTLFAAGGCGGGASDAKERASASGKVVVDGKPISSGNVVFMHVDSGTLVACPISEGAYSSVSGEGPLLGKNMVSVSALDKTTGERLSSQKGIEVEVTSSGYTGDITLAAEDVLTAQPEEIDEEEKALNAAAENK